MRSSRSKRTQGKKSSGTLSACADYYLARDKSENGLLARIAIRLAYIVLFVKCADKRHTKRRGRLNLGSDDRARIPALFGLTHRHESATSFHDSSYKQRLFHVRNDTSCISGTASSESQPPRRYAPCIFASNGRISFNCDRNSFFSSNVKSFRASRADSCASQSKYSNSEPIINFCGRLNTHSP